MSKPKKVWCDGFYIATVTKPDRTRTVVCGCGDTPEAASAHFANSKAAQVGGAIKRLEHIEPGWVQVSA